MAGRQRFSIIPASAVTDPNVEPRDLQVLCLLGRHTDNDGWCCRSQVQMAKELGCGRATVYRALARLVEAGYLEHRAKRRASGGDAAHDYRVIFDQQRVEPRAKDDAQTPSEDGDKGVPIYGQGVPTQDGQGVPTHERAPRLTTPVKRIERDARASKGFEKARKAWPSGFADSREEALEAWNGLTPDEQQTAAEEIGRFVAAGKAIGRKHICKFATYLTERRWSVLPDKPKPKPERALDEPPPPPMASKPTAFQRAHPELYPEKFPELAGNAGKACADG